MSSYHSSSTGRDRNPGDLFEASALNCVTHVGMMIGEGLSLVPASSIQPILKSHVQATMAGMRGTDFGKFYGWEWRGNEDFEIDIRYIFDVAASEVSKTALDKLQYETLMCCEAVVDSVLMHNAGEHTNVMNDLFAFAVMSVGPVS